MVAQEFRYERTDLGTYLKGNMTVDTLNKTFTHKIDNEFKAVLSGVRQPYLTVTGSPMQRVEQIMKFINE